MLAPGLLSTIQDRGRFGYGRYGVPPSGAIDPFSLRVANLLVDNPEDEACLEITLLGLKVRALTDAAIAVTGADLQPFLNDEPLEMWRSHVLKKGDILSFKGVKSGCRSYLAIGGGISLPVVMGSKSTNISSKFGGLEGRPLRGGDILHSEAPRFHLLAEGRRFPQGWVPPYGKEWRLKVIFGPQDDQFTERGKETFIGSAYQVSPQTDRTGIRLAGAVIERRPEVGESIISEGVISGTIQVPGDGQPIIILVETVTGGYRKIATVITADLPLLGQLRPGDTVRFKQVSLDEASQALGEMEERIKRFKEGLSLS
ncbi:MAG: biotin-dependent carboxyltransferase [Deltaproteobacteria bacterium]|nr:biotin-dependent carboxyltransferase [Deltaproteobacteria bacterium]